MPAITRTSEFRSCVESIRLRSQHGGPTSSSSGRKQKGQTSRSEFTKQAASIAKEIGETTGKLEKLAQLAKRKTLFDDRPVEISELTYIIKQNIATINSKIQQLQTLSNGNDTTGGGGSGSKTGKGRGEHHQSVVVMLQGQLANTSIGFKDILEIRTQNMKATRERTEQLGMASNSSTAAPGNSGGSSNSGPGGGAPGPSSSSSGSPFTGNSALSPDSGRTGLRSRRLSSANLDHTNKDSPLYSGYGGSGGGNVSTSKQGGKEYLALDMGEPEGGYQQMEMLEEGGSQSYMDSRSRAIEGIESTINELGQIFSQLATMVAQQGEQVQRIDADVIDIESNVGGAQRELLKTLSAATSNRSLMLKVFGVIIVFFLLFVLVS